MMRCLLALVAFISFGSYAKCIGTETHQTCSDGHGNSYTVRRIGNDTYITGQTSNGDTWSQQSSRSNNTVITTGHNKNGESWSSTTTYLSDGSSVTTGKDANGNAFSDFSYSYPDENYN